MSNTHLISRESIKCDGPDCVLGNPGTRCEICRVAYYCSKDCQTNHWEAEHKDQCLFLAADAKAIRASRCDAKIQKTVTETCINTACPVCLEDVLEIPLLLDSNHSICVLCMIDHQRMLNRRSGTIVDTPMDVSGLCLFCEKPSSVLYRVSWMANCALMLDKEDEKYDTLLEASCYTIYWRCWIRTPEAWDFTLQVRNCF
jgi:hypothetical protein